MTAFLKKGILVILVTASSQQRTTAKNIKPFAQAGFVTGIVGTLAGTIFFLKNDKDTSKKLKFSKLRKILPLITVAASMGLIGISGSVLGIFEKDWVSENFCEDQTCHLNLIRRLWRS